MKEYTLNRLIRIATALTLERDIDRLLFRILKEAIDYTGCDGGTVYLKEGEALRHCYMITRSRGLKAKAGDGGIDLPPVPLTRGHICACAAMDHVKINIPDVYLNEQYDFSGSRRYDRLNDYRTVSMLAVPMEVLPDDTGNGDVIGVLQLINAMDENGEIVAFPEACERIVFALASLAAVSLRSNRLARSIYDILNSFVRVMVGAIDTRSSYNANHTKSMVRYAENFLTWMESADIPQDKKIPVSEREPFLMSIWLHDIGKLVIPLSVMDKATKLGRLETDVRHRLEIADIMERLRAAEDPAQKSEAEEKRRQYREAAELIFHANVTGILEEETIEQLNRCAKIRCLTSDGTAVPLLTEEELDAITVPRGTLTEKERRVMETHVVQTARMLSEMKFAGTFAQVPAWADAHHELLDGSGYPDGKTGAAIPREVRLMTILDIYDALTAEDRPYKPPMPPEEAFAILTEMADEGKIDAELLTLFRESNAWTRKTE
ncbi:MAG: GAF domain-containing protein [Lachnospiraceae bacterium]|nr:GAF domain-containing protein [Lachnospiraceae bacterium]